MASRSLISWAIFWTCGLGSPPNRRVNWAGLSRLASFIASVMLPPCRRGAGSPFRRSSRRSRHWEASCSQRPTGSGVGLEGSAAASHAYEYFLKWGMCAIKVLSLKSSDSATGCTRSTSKSDFLDEKQIRIPGALSMAIDGLAGAAWPLGCARAAGLPEGSRRMGGLGRCGRMRWRTSPRGVWCSMRSDVEPSRSASCPGLSPSVAARKNSMLCLLPKSPSAATGSTSATNAQSYKLGSSPLASPAESL
mmetsp:Transcript_12989/g.30648  ORF Transcript_12989/g.30648 Transcript_12989/m.30648 type:complete len:249 (-) Transcript_12989:207-953(-)